MNWTVTRVSQYAPHNERIKSVEVHAADVYQAMVSSGFQMNEIVKVALTDL